MGTKNVIGAEKTELQGKISARLCQRGTTLQRKYCGIALPQRSPPSLNSQVCIQPAPLVEPAHFVSQCNWILRAAECTRSISSSQPPLGHTQRAVSGTVIDHGLPPHLCTLLVTIWDRYQEKNFMSVVHSRL